MFNANTNDSERLISVCTVESENVTVDSLAKNVNFQKTYENIRKKEHEEQKIKEEYEKIERENTIKNVAEKLKINHDSAKIEAFLECASQEYLRLIEKNKNYLTLTAFEKVRIKRMCVEHKYLKWQIEKACELSEDGYLYATFYTYALCAFDYCEKIKKITLEIKYQGKSDAVGGFYCDNEEYLPLSPVEIKNLLDNMLKEYNNPFKEYEYRLFSNESYKKLISCLDEIQQKGKVSGAKKVDTILRIFSEKEFIWEIDNGENIPYAVSENTVYIKKLKNNYLENVPLIYMLSDIKTYLFEPVLENTICVVYENVCYIFRKNYECLYVFNKSINIYRLIK